MRGTRDALRSMARYLDLALNGGAPTLGEVYYQPDPAGPRVYRWTHGGVSPGCLEVSEAAWTWLARSQRGPDTAVVGSGASDGRRWAESGLVWDPGPYLASVGLPTSGTPVAASSLGPAGNPWEVRLWADRGEFTEPFCRVQLVTAGGTSGPSLYYSVSQPMAIECYPERADHPEEAIDRATSVVDLLVHAFLGRGVDLARPRRVPMYDYDGVSLAAGVADSRIPSDFMRVEDFSARPLPDLTEPRRVAAVADVRVSWRKDIRPEDLPRRVAPIGGAGGGESVGGIRGTRPVQSVKIEVDGS